jgi:threonine/homoserine/homoserine lactone efflux protein
MIWWFLILGASTLVVVCVVLALYMHLRKNLQKTLSSPDGVPKDEKAGRR